MFRKCKRVSHDYQRTSQKNQQSFTLHNQFVSKESAFNHLEITHLVERTNYPLQTLLSYGAFYLWTYVCGLSFIQNQLYFDT